MFIINIVEFFMFNNKMMIDFFKWLNDLYEKYKIIKNNWKNLLFFYYYNIKHVNVIYLFFKYVYKD